MYGQYFEKIVDQVVGAWRKKFKTLIKIDQPGSFALYLLTKTVKAPFSLFQFKFPFFSKFLDLSPTLSSAFF